MTENMKKFIKQFISYFFVGGVAALVEWGTFFVCSSLCNLGYITSTIIAFVIATIVNFILGRLWTFKNSQSFKNKRGLEFIFVFIVSAVGLLFNVLLMYIFVSVLKLDTEILKLVSKIIATGIVFVWNFLIRKFIVYRN